MAGRHLGALNFVGTRALQRRDRAHFDQKLLLHQIGGEFPKLFAGGAYPPNTLLIVDRLVQEQFLIEVSAVAAL